MYAHVRQKKGPPQRPAAGSFFNFERGESKIFFLSHQLTVLVEFVRILLFFFSSAAVLALVFLVMTLMTQADQVVRIQSDLRIPNVLRIQMPDVMHFLCRCTAVPAQIFITHQDELPDLQPFL